MIDFSHKLYEYCTISNIANNCNLYDHQRQLDFIEQRINYFLEEISFISRQARNITNISKTNDPSLQQIQKVLLELRMRQETYLYWPKEDSFLLSNPFFQKVTNLSLKLGNIVTYEDWHNSQKDPNIHLYRILAANLLKKTCMKFLNLFFHSLINLQKLLSLPQLIYGTLCYFPISFWTSNLTKKKK